MKARTASEFQVVIEDAAPVDLDANPQLVRSAEPPPSLAQLIIRPGESGGLLTPSEFRFAKFCAEQKLKKRTSDCLLGMLKERAFVLEDLHADSIREIEKLISDSCRLGVKRTYSDQPMEAISDQQRHAKGTGAKGCQSETSSTYASHPGESLATTGDEDSDEHSSSVRLMLSALCRPSCR